MEDVKAPVKRRALHARVKRLLASRGEQLKGCSPRSEAYGELGNLYVVNNCNKIVKTKVELAELAKELKALHPWEIFVE